MAGAVRDLSASGGERQSRPPPRATLCLNCRAFNYCTKPVNAPRISQRRDLDRSEPIEGELRKGPLLLGQFEITLGIAVIPRPGHCSFVDFTIDDKVNRGTASRTWNFCFHVNCTGFGVERRFL